MRYLIEKSKKWIICLVVGVLVSGHGLALGQGLSLDMAFKMAVENNPRLAQALAVQKGAEAKVMQAVGNFLPKVNLQLGYTRSNNPVKVFSDKLNQSDFSQTDFLLDVLNNPDYRSAWQAKLIFFQPIFNKGKEYIGYKSSQVGKDISHLMVKKALNAILYQVEKAYCQVLLAKEKVGVLKAAMKTASRHEQLAVKRYEAGLVLKSDVLSARVHAAQIERELFQAESDYKVAMAALNNALGVEQNKKWELEALQSELHDAGSLDEWLEKAKSYRPEYLIAKDNVVLASYRHKQALFQFFPSFNLHGIYQTDRENLAYFGGDSWTFMATMSMNLFNGLSDKAGLDQAVAQEERARARLKEVVQQIELEVRQSYYSFETSKKQLLVARRAVRQAKESQKILKNRYENGLALMVELLAADTALKKTMLQEADARFKARLAWSDLMKKVGLLGKNFMVEEKTFVASER